MCNLGTLRLPVLMWDHENKSNPAASMWVFHNNVRLACCEAYDGLLHQLRGANAEANRAVLQYCEGGDWNDEMDEDLELTAVLIGMPAAAITCLMSRIGEVGLRLAMAIRASG